MDVDERREDLVEQDDGPLLAEGPVVFYDVFYIPIGATLHQQLPLLLLADQFEEAEEIDDVWVSLNCLHTQGFLVDRFGRFRGTHHLSYDGIAKKIKYKESIS